MPESDWTETASVDNGAATATRAAEARARHCITSIIASFSAATASKLLTVVVGGKTLEFYVTNGQMLNFATPLRGSANEAVSASLGASGTGGVLGKVAMSGYTR